MRRLILSMTVLMVFVQVVLARTELNPKPGYFWYFGDHAGIDFTSGNATPLINGAMRAFEGCVTQSDPEGNLLFYSNGGPLPYPGKVWNANHQQMPNGDLTNGSGCGSSFQSAMVLPHPANPNVYYMFTTDCIENNFVGGLRYNIIDMNLDGGLGDIVPNQKNILLTGPVNEAMTAIRHANGKEYWILVNKLNTDTIYSYHLTANGITGLVKSKTGFLVPNFAGGLRASVNGEKMVFSCLTFSFLMDFDPATGQASNAIDLQTPSFSGAFSWNCQYLYVGDNQSKNIYQYDVLASDVAASRVTIGSTTSLGFGSMQLGPDTKIYVARFVGSQFLGVINTPDYPGTAANYVDNGFYLGGKTSIGGLPNYANFQIGECLPYPVDGQTTFSHPSYLRVNNISANEAEVEWTAVPGSLLYDVMLRDQKTGVITRILTESNLLELTELKPSNMYEVTVTAIHEESNYEPINHYFIPTGSVKEGIENRENFQTLSDLNVSIYPNPAASAVNLAVNFPGRTESLRVTISDATGRTVKDVELGRISGYLNSVIDIAGLADGLYQVAIQSDYSRTTEKLMVLKR